MKITDKKTDKAEALALLEQAWEYYLPEDIKKDQEPELFQYANAA